MSTQSGNMDWNVRHGNITAEEFWTLWDVNQDAFSSLILAEGAQRSGVAALALLIWDILTTMDDEVKLIWPSKWTLPKILYLLVRYYSLFTLLLHNFHIIPCVPWLIFEILSTFAVELATELILMYRVYAVYGGQLKVLRIMQLGFAFQFVVMAVSLGISMPKIMGGFYCQAADLPVEMVVYSSASILYETFLFGLMMVGVIRGGKDGFANTTLLTVLIRDGTMAFVGVFLVMLLNTILFTLAPTTLVMVGFPWLLAILGAGGSRLVLNLRSTHARHTSQPTTFADVNFAVPSHVYSALQPDEREEDDYVMPASPDEESSLSPSSSSSMSEDPETDREDAALNPSRSNTGGTGRTHENHRSGRRGHERAYSESPSSPLSPQTLLPV